MADRENRQYNTTDVPTLRTNSGTSEDRDLLLKLYDQTCATWRMLVDVRFKLFALVPTVSLISLATVFSGGDATKYFPPKLRLLFAILGLAATLGLLVYELRNSQLHDDLISRGRKIEDELGVHAAVFRGRKKPKGLIHHTSATYLIYGAALVAWVASICGSVTGLFRGSQ